MKNTFYADLYPDGQIWLGLTTVHAGTDFVAGTCQENEEDCELTPVTTSSLDGLSAFFTNWGDEFVYAENISAAGAFAYIDTRNLRWGDEIDDVNYWNNNKSDSDLAKAIFGSPENAATYLDHMMHKRNAATDRAELLAWGNRRFG